MGRREFWAARLDDEFPEARNLYPQDMARLCEVTVRTVQRWIAEGKLLALAGDDEAEETYHARIPREAALEFLVRRTPPVRYPEQWELFFG